MSTPGAPLLPQQSLHSRCAPVIQREQHGVDDDDDHGDAQEATNAAAFPIASSRTCLIERSG
jgi:hypothetical protein